MRVYGEACQPWTLVWGQGLSQAQTDGGWVAFPLLQMQPPRSGHVGCTCVRGTSQHHLSPHVPPPVLSVLLFHWSKLHPNTKRGREGEKLHYM